MIDIRVVRRYADAIFMAAQKKDAVDRIESDLGLISYAIERSPELLSTLKSPLVNRIIKKDIIRDLFQDKVHEITLSFLLLLVDKRREETLLSIESEYILRANQARGIMIAEAVTAVKMEDEQAEKLVAKLESITRKKIHLVKKVDPQIIGGVLIKIGDRIIDGSVKGRLEELKQKLLS